MDNRLRLIREIQDRVPEAVDWMLEPERKGIGFQFPILLDDGVTRFIVMLSKNGEQINDQTTTE